jgi:adenosylhomocysteine nucleosidase
VKLGIVTGIKSETDCLSEISERSDILVKCAGARPELAHDCAAELISKGCDALLSFGIAGGLSPDINVGHIVIPDQVILPNGDGIQTDTEWRQRLLDKLPSSVSVSIDVTAGSDTIAASIETKLSLFTHTRAVAVDMESHRVAKIARDHNVPFMVIRAVSDTSNESIPRSALNVIDENGQPLYSKVVSQILQHPGDIPKLIKLSRNTNTALASLRRVALAATPLFQLA